MVGCSGAIGSRLTSTLLESDHIVYGVRGTNPCMINNVNHYCSQIDLLNPNLSLNLLDFQPEVLVHTAWITTPGIFWESPENINWVSASKKLIQEFKICGGKYLVVTSSCAEYSWSTINPLSETSEVTPNSIYGKSKLELLNWVSDYNIPFLWARIFFKFGLNEPKGRLIPSLIDSLAQERKFEVYNGNDLRDFIYIIDVVKILEILIHQEQLGIVNIGTGRAIDVKSISQIVAELMGRKNLLVFQKPNRSPSIVVSDSTKLSSLVGDYLWTPIKESIQETIKFRSKIEFKS